MEGIVSVRASALETMTIQKVYKHILNDSVWAWRKLSAGVDEDQLPALVRAEMRRAGRCGDLWYFGSVPNRVQDVNVPASHWDYSYFGSTSFDNEESVAHTVIESSDTPPADAKTLNIRAVQGNKVEVIWPTISWPHKKWIELKRWYLKKTTKSVTTS